MITLHDKFLACERPQSCTEVHDVNLRITNHKSDKIRCHGNKLLIMIMHVMSVTKLSMIEEDNTD